MRLDTLAQKVRPLMLVDFSLSREKLKHELRAMKYGPQVQAQRLSGNTQAKLDSLKNKFIILLLFHFSSLLPIVQLIVCYYPLLH